MEQAQMRTWAEIDLNALAHNYRALRSNLEPGCRFVGVVKANAYGHGAIPVAKKLEELGAEYLAVACLDEAVELREAGIHAPILILGGTPGQFAAELLRYDITQTVFDLSTAKEYSAAAQKADKLLKVHIKADTGMGRLGFFGKDRMEEIKASCALPGLDCEGLFTHFADADGSEEYTMGQFTDFLDLRAALAKEGVTFKINHCAASAAMLHYPCTHLDMVRPGIALYGHYPDEGSVGLDGPGLIPVMTLKTRVAAVRTLPAGSCISYGRTHVLGRESRLAVLPVGYADGLHRGLSNRMEVAFPSGRAPVVGWVCMDLCMADVTDLPEVQAGDVAEVFGKILPVEEKSDALDTISYECLTSVSRRVPRVYGNGEG